MSTECRSTTHRHRRIGATRRRAVEGDAPGHRRARLAVRADRPRLRLGAFTPQRQPVQAGERRRRADRRRASRSTRPLHHLPRREPAGRARPRPVAGRCRPGGRLLPGVHRPDAGRRERRADPRKEPFFTPRRSTRWPRTSRPTAAARRSRERRPARRRRDRHGRRAVPAQLRVLPQLHRPGRRALAGQVRARTWTRRPTGRSAAPCSAARRTCPSSVTAS